MKKHLHFKKTSFSGEDILLIGPGTSTSQVNMTSLLKQFNYTCTINDTFFNFYSSFWISGVSLAEIQLYTEKDVSLFKSRRCMKLLITRTDTNRGILSEEEGLHSELIKSWPNTYLLTNIDTGFEVTDLEAQKAFFFEHFPQADLGTYMRMTPGGSLAYALQIFYHLGFSRVYLIGFLDSQQFSHRKTPMSEFQNLKSQRMKTQRSDKEYIQRKTFYLDVLAAFYNQEKREIINLCPEETAIYHGFQFGQIT